MKLVVAIDSFKGAASSEELNEAVKTGVLSANAEITVEAFEFADGGEDSISALKSRLDGELITFETVDLLQRHMVAKYLFVNKTAFIESAEVIGIDKIVPTVETIQKGGTVEVLESQDLQAIPGTGTAGGLGAASVLLGGKIESGLTKIAEMIQIEKILKRMTLLLQGKDEWISKRKAEKFHLVWQSYLENIKFR